MSIPRKNAYRLIFTMLDTSGLLVADKTVAVSISQDGAAFASVGNATGISGGFYYIDLSSTNMDAQNIAILGTASSSLAYTATVIIDPDIYTSKVSLTVDSVGTSDRWESSWFKNGAPYSPTAGTPQLQVVKSSDGANLIPPTNMTQIASTGRWKYTAITTERVSAGAAYYITTTAKIGRAHV